MSGFVERDGAVVFELTSTKASRWHSWDCSCGGGFDALVKFHLRPAGIATLPHTSPAVLACTWDGIAAPAAEADWEVQKAATSILFEALRLPVGFA